MDFYIGLRNALTVMLAVVLLGYAISSHAIITICIGGGCAQTDGGWNGQDIVGMPVGTVDNVPVSVTDPEATAQTFPLLEDGANFNEIPLTPEQAAAAGQPGTLMYCAGNCLTGTHSSPEAACSAEGYVGYDAGTENCLCENEPPFEPFPCSAVGGDYECPDGLTPLLDGSNICAGYEAGNDEPDIKFNEDGTVNPEYDGGDLEGMLPAQDPHGGYSSPVGCTGSDCQAGFYKEPAGGYTVYSGENGTITGGGSSGAVARRECWTTVHNGTVTGGCTYYDTTNGNTITDGTFSGGGSNSAPVTNTPYNGGYGGLTGGGSTGGVVTLAVGAILAAVAMAVNVIL